MNLVIERQEKGRKLALTNSVVSLEVCGKIPIVRTCRRRVKPKSYILPAFINWNLQVIPVWKKEATEVLTLYWIIEHKDKEW